MTSRTVWAVASGEYSDYGVIALFENEADAIATADALNKGRSSEWAIENYVQDFTLYDEPPEVEILYQAVWNYMQGALGLNKGEPTLYCTASASIVVDGNHHPAVQSDFLPKVVMVRGTNKELVRKVTAEHITKRIAEESLPFQVPDIVWWNDSPQGGSSPTVDETP